MDLNTALQYAKDVGLAERDIAGVVRAEADRVRFAQAGGKVAITNELLPGRVEYVDPDSVEQHKAAGWVVKAADAAEETEPDVPADKPKTLKEKP